MDLSLIASILGAVLALAFFWVNYINTGDPEAEGIPAPIRPAIPREVREEIDQDPAWWDREFHKALSRVSPKVEIDAGEDEYIEERTLTSTVLHRIAKPYEYLGCTCRDCKSARMRR